MAMDKTQTILSFHNMLSMQVKNLHKGMEVEERRPNNLTSFFRFYTETPGVTYVLQTEVKTTHNAYLIDVAVIEEVRNADGEVKPELIDNKVFEVRELGMTDRGVKTVMKYVRGMIKAVVSNEEQVFDTEE